MKPVLTSALQVPAYRRYFICGWFSTIGFWVFKIALGWAAWEISKSPFWTGVVVASALAPSFVLTPIFGVFTDRWRLKKAMAVIVGGQFTVSMLFTFGSGFDWLNLPFLITFSLAHGTLVAAYSPLRLSIMPRLVPKHLYLSAAGMGAFIFNFSRIVGPAVGGYVILQFGLGAAFAISSASYVIFLVFFFLVPLNPKEGKANPPKGVFAELVDGFKFAIRLPDAGLLLLLTGLNGLLGRSFFEILPAYAGAVLDAGVEGLATLTAASGVGAALLGIFLQIVKGGKHGTVFAISLVLMSSAFVFAGLGLASNLLAAAILAGIMGFVATFIGVASQTRLQMSTDDHHRGRVMSIWTTVSLGMPAVGAFILGGLGSTLGMSNAFMVSGSTGLILLLIITLFRRREYG